jgi:hypothetical protein
MRKEIAQRITTRVRSGAVCITKKLREASGGAALAIGERHFPLVGDSSATIS